MAQLSVSLRDAVNADLPILFENQRDPVANRLAAFPPRDWDAFEQHMRLRVLSNPATLTRIIVVDGDVAGVINSWHAEDGRRFTGYWLGRAFWGRGVATQGMRQFLTIETVRPLFAFVLQSNVPSVRVLQKCGFTTVPGRHVGRDGLEQDLYCLGAHA